MSEDTRRITAADLRLKEAKTRPAPPPDYNMRRSILEPITMLTAPTVVAVALGIVVVAFSSVATTARGPNSWHPARILLVIALVYVWFFVRASWVWIHRTITINAKTGQMLVKQGGPLLLGLSQSSSDTVSLSEARIVTIDRTLLQRAWAFNCDTMEITEGNSVRYIRNIRNTRHIELIQEYVKGLPQQQAVTLHLLYEVNLATLQALEYIEEHLATLVDRLNSPFSQSTPTIPPALEK